MLEARDRALFGTLVKPAEDLFFDPHVFEDRFDDEIVIGQGIEVQPGVRSAMRVHVRLRQRALPRYSVVSADGAEAVIECACVVDDRDRNSGVEKFIEMPPPIVPAPMMPTFLIGSSGVMIWYVGDFRHLALAKNT